jgi:hypothetical protein
VSNTHTHGNTEFLFSGLEPATTYGLQITATKGSETSMASAEHTIITLTESAGVHDIFVDINSDTAIYDLQGRKVKNPAKGLYIKNGKKVVVR